VKGASVTATQIVYRLTLASTPKNVMRVEPFLKKLSKTLHLDEIQFHKLMVSMTEAVNNAILHGNKTDPTKKVSVVCEVLPGWLLVLINDQGRGFKPERIGNPLKKENLLKESGRGIFLMRTLMDKVEFEAVGTGMQVRLWLALHK
jgi:serine/threonine-protein kinase RsbW